MSADPSTALMHARLRQHLFAATDLPQIGRYRLESKIGAGGMGVVYSARDPELNRTVAIKLMRPGSAQDATLRRGTERLLREAQAMAALSHPNVLPIYDVGAEGDDVFLAMELVDGLTLRQWLAQRPRSEAEILATFGAAARGLHAAHEAGLVHRDFKPSNVLVGHDGRVFVMDFGLARSVASVAEDIVTGERCTGELGDALTMTGTAVGSPVYMSPQQHRGERADPKADQWSFCIALYEALYGVTPYVGDNLSELRAAIAAGDLVFPRRDPRVSTRTRNVLRRGLQHEPGLRFGTMAQLLTALQRRKSRGVGGAAVLAVGAVVAASAWSFAGAEEAPGCAAQDESVWSARRRNALASRFADAPPWLRDTWQRTEQAIDSYHDEWSQRHREACALPLAEAGPDRALAQASRSCLGHAAAALDATLSVLEELELDEATKSVQMVMDLPALEQCGAETPDPVESPEAAPLVSMLHRARALRRASRSDAALELLADAPARARQLGAVRLEVQLLRQQGLLQRDLGRFAQSAASLEQSVWAGEGAHLERSVAQSAIEALHTAAAQGSADDMKRWTALARAKVALLGDEPDLRARLSKAVSDAADARGDYAEAERFALLAESQSEGVRDDLGYASTVIGVGRAHYRAKRWEQAEEAYGRALVILERVVGPDHPSSLKVGQNIALVAIGAGQFERARDLVVPMIPKLRAVFAKGEPVAAALNIASIAHDGLGEAAEALRLTEESLAIRREVLGPGLPVAMMTYNVGNKLTAAGRFEEAATHHRASIEMLTTAVDPMHPLLVRPLLQLADLSIDLNNLDEADRRLTRAGQIYDAIDAPPAERAVMTYYRGLLAEARGQRVEARRLAAQALHDARLSEDKTRIPIVTDGMVEWLEAHPAP